MKHDCLRNFRLVVKSQAVDSFHSVYFLAIVIPVGCGTNLDPCSTPPITSSQSPLS